MSGVVVGVVGGSGGVGASTFASQVALSAPGSTLIDLDPVGGGIDVLLGVEDLPGARWSGLRVDGGHLEPALLADGLPRWRDVPPPGPAAVAQVITAAAQLGPVVLDLPREPSPTRATAVAQCAVCVLVASAEIRAIVAADAVRRSLEVARLGVVMRRAGMAVAEAIPLLGLPLIGVLPSLERGQRGAARVARGVLDGLAA